MKKAWSTVDNVFYLYNKTSEQDYLNSAIYSLRIDKKGDLFLLKIDDKFTFDFKIYGLERSFIDRVKKSYSNTRGNFGVLLNGVKGTGKSVTAKILSNELNLPVIMVSAKYAGLSNFLLDIHQDVVVLIDEYEKIYSNDDYNDFREVQSGEEIQGDTSLLSVMDGVQTCKYRRFFILTTNHTWIDSNLLNRPGRLRYVRSFGDLSKEQILEIMDDMLLYPEWRNDILSFMKPLKIITADIVKAIVSEVNIFNENPNECCKDLNVENKDIEYTVYTVEGDKKHTITTEAKYADIRRFIEPGSGWRNGIYLGENDFFIRPIEKPDYKNKTVKIKGDDEEIIVIGFEKTVYSHKNLIF